MAARTAWAKVEEWGNKSVARALGVKPQNIDKVKGFDLIPSKVVEGRRVWKADDIRVFAAKRKEQQKEGGDANE